MFEADFEYSEAKEEEGLQTLIANTIRMQWNAHIRISLRLWTNLPAKKI